jgi:hypothetical protein
MSPRYQNALLPPILIVALAPTVAKSFVSGSLIEAPSLSSIICFVQKVIEDLINTNDLYHCFELKQKLLYSSQQA